MKNNKILTSLMALVLLLGVGACSEIETESSNEKGENNETETNSNEDESGLGSDAWKGGNATSPSELTEKAYYLGNYSLEIEYDYYESVDTMTYDEYIAAVYGDSEALEKYNDLVDGAVFNEATIIDVYYDVDYFYLEAYMSDGVNKTFLMKDFALNTDDGVWEYWTYDDETWSYWSPDRFKVYGASIWEDYYNSLFSAYESGISDHLVYYAQYNQIYDAYDFDDWKYNYYYGEYFSEYSANWFVALGGEWLFSSYAYTYAYYYYLHYLTYFSQSYQEFMSWYYYSFLDYTDDTKENIYYGEEDIFFTVYDVGSTDKRDTVEDYHNALQALI